MMIREFTFTVRGRGAFPIDMLRYDACWPTTAEDAQKITDSFDRSIRPTLKLSEGVTVKGYEVTLTTFAAFNPTDERWESFMFRVMPKRYR